MSFFLLFSLCTFFFCHITIFFFLAWSLWDGSGNPGKERSLLTFFFFFKLQNFFTHFFGGKRRKTKTATFITFNIQLHTFIDSIFTATTTFVSFCFHVVFVFSARISFVFFSLPTLGVYSSCRRNSSGMKYERPRKIPKQGVSYHSVLIGSHAFLFTSLLQYFTRYLFFLYTLGTGKYR